MKPRQIYLDYASLTPIDPRVSREMIKYSGPEYANPSSWYVEGVSAKKVLDNSRKSVADFLHAHTDEIVFTSGGTESNNLAILGVVEKALESGRKHENLHIIASAIEHSSVLECLNKLREKI